MGQDIKRYINSLYIMGGAIYVRGTRGSGVKNTSHKEGPGVPETWAEFNFYCELVPEISFHFYLLADIDLLESEICSF